jgi:AraC family transcriptional regulator
LNRIRKGEQLTDLKAPRFEESRAMLFAGLRREHSFTDAIRSVPEQWRQFQELGVIPGQIGETTYGAVCASSLDRQMFEYMCAVEVSDFAGLPANLGRMRVPVQRYAVFTHSGHISGLRTTWEAIWNDWLPRSGKEPADTPDFEVYDERFDRATGLGVIEIWFPIKAG